MDTYAPPLEGRSVNQHLLLDFNERTLPVSETVVNALCDYIRSGQLQRYPSYGNVVEKLATYTGAQADQIMITNGSDQGIDLAIRAALSPGDEAIIPVPSFAMYKQCAEVEKAKIIAPYYEKDEGYPTGEVLSAISSKTKLIVIALPNNPCGSDAPIDDIETILRAAPDSVVLVDECYFEYSGKTVIGLVDKYANLVITRTFSKTWGIPSLRFGFLISQPDNIAQLMKIRGPYDINQLAVVAAEAALEEPGYTKDYVREVMDEAKPMLEAWLKEKGIEFWQSDANYVWAFPNSAIALAGFLQKNNILVRPKNNHQGATGLRITVGNIEQIKELLACMNKFYD